MAETIQGIFAIFILVFMWDQKNIQSLQRRGMYNPDSHQTALSRIFSAMSLPGLLSNAKAVKMNFRQQVEYLPPGDLSNYRYQSVICADKRGKRTRLSQFKDEHQHLWYKIERIDGRGTVTHSPLFEPATVSFNEKKMQFI